MTTDPGPTTEDIQEVLESLECILTAHESCAELLSFKEKTAVIYCGGPCKNCDNRCIEEAIKDKFPDVEVVIQ